MYRIVTGDICWMETDNLQYLKEFIQYITDSACRLNDYEIVFPDGKRSPFESIRELFHIEKRSFEDRMKSKSKYC